MAAPFYNATIVAVDCKTVNPRTAVYFSHKIGMQKILVILRLF
jgi:hypothetical protein